MSVQFIENYSQKPFFFRHSAFGSHTQLTKPNGEDFYQLYIDTPSFEF